MSATDPVLVLASVYKRYERGLLHPQTTFQLEANLTFNNPAIVGVMGPNGAGKTTLFEIVTGTTPPSQGMVLCSGQNIHNVKYHERSRLAIHYHQSYQVRRIKWTKPGFMLEEAKSDHPLIHLFDEPPFNTQDGYITFMVNFFKKLRSEGRLVFVSLHPTEVYQLEVLNAICDSYMFVYKGHTRLYDNWEHFVAEPHVRNYLSTALVEFEVRHHNLMTPL